MYSQEGNAFIRSGDTLTGNYAVQINDPISGQHVSDQGSVKLRFKYLLDKVELTLINRAGHSNPALFMNGQQTFSYGIGDLSFLNGTEAVSTSPAFATPAADLSVAGPLTVGTSPTGRMLIRVIDPLNEVPDLSRLEMSPDLSAWNPFSKTGAFVRAIDGGAQIELPPGPIPAAEFYRWLK